MPTRRRLVAVGLAVFGSFSVGNTSAKRKKKKKKKNDVCPSGDVNCDQFATHDEAQRFFEKCGGPGQDRYGLDTDHDGIACEQLP